MFFIFSFNGKVYSQYDTINRTDSNGVKYGYWEIYGNDLKFKGKGYVDTMAVEKGFFLKGKKSGLWKVFYSTGILKFEAQYKNNRPNGKYSTYYESGCIEETGSWNGISNIGEYKRYYNNGVIQQEKTYNTGSKVDGKLIYRYSNGQIEVEYYMINGIEEGKSMRYYPNGDLKEKTYFTNGRRDESRHTLYEMINPDVDLNEFEIDCNGNKLTIKTNDDNLVWQKMYDKNKKIVAEGEFKNGKLWNGKHYEYDKNGLFIKIEIYKEGKYFADGQLD